jgi:cell division protein FtsW
MPAAGLLVATTAYVKARFVAFLNPEAWSNTSGWHIIQFQRTLAAGGLYGRSWGRALCSRSHLPLGYSDSVFATIGETAGLIGVAPFVILPLIYLLYGSRQARATGNTFRQAAIIGMVSMVAGQAYIHLSVNLGLLPPTGITLPLISYGGSSLLATVTAVGIVESLSRHPPSPSPPVPA